MAGPLELRSVDDVEKWVSERGISALEREIINPNFGDINKQVASQWLDLRQSRIDAENQERIIKATEVSANAASTSAKAAVDSEKHARGSKKAAFWAVGIAVVAALATIVQAVAAFSGA